MSGQKSEGDGSQYAADTDATDEEQGMWAGQNRSGGNSFADQEKRNQQMQMLRQRQWSMPWGILQQWNNQQQQQQRMNDQGGNGIIGRWGGWG